MKAERSDGSEVWSISVPGGNIGSLQFTVAGGRLFIPFQGDNSYAGCGD